MPILDDNDIFTVTTLVYREWAKAFDNLKAEKAAKPDYKLEPDWDAFHAIRLANGEVEVNKWKALLDRCTLQCPRI